MALTETLEPASPRGNVVDARGTSSNFLTGLAHFGSQLLDAADTRKKSQQALDDRATQNDAVKSYVAGLGNAAGRSLMTVPKIAEDAHKQLTVIQKAEDQGQRPAGSVDMYMEDFISRTLAQHPDQAAVAFDYLKKNGWDHYLFRGTQDKMEQDEQDRLVDLERRKQALQVGRVLVGPQADDEKAVTMGFQYLLEKQQAEANKLAWDAALAKTNADSAEYKFRKERNIEATITMVNKKWDSMYGALSSHAMLVSNGLTDADITDWTKTMDQGLAAVETGRNAALQEMAGADQSVLDHINKKFDGWKTQLTTIRDMPAENRKKMFEFMTDTLGLKAEQAFPAYQTLNKALGPQMASSVFMGMYPLSKEATAQLKKEASGVDFSDLASTELFLPRMISLLRGKAELSEFHGNIRSDALKVVANGVDVVSKQVAGGVNDPATLVAGVVPMTKLLNAVRENITPNTKDTGAVSTATSMIAQPHIRAYVKALAKNPSTAEDGRALGVATVGASALTFTTAKTQGQMQLNDNALGIVRKVEYDKATGKYRIAQLTRQDYAAFMKRQQQGLVDNMDSRGGVGVVNQAMRGTGMSYEDFIKTRSEPLEKQVDILNKSLDNLTGLKEFDDVLKSQTDMAIRNHYALGTPLDLGETKKIDSARDAWLKDFQNLQAETVNLSTGVVAKSAQQQAESTALEDVDPTESAKSVQAVLKTTEFPPVAQAAIVGALHWESGGVNPNSVNKDSGAFGIANWLGDRLYELKAFAEQRGKQPNDLGVQTEFLLHELRGAEGRKHDVYKKLMAAKTPEEAAEAMANFERAQGWTKENPRGIDHWNDRLSLTKRYAKNG